MRFALHHATILAPALRAAFAGAALSTATMSGAAQAQSAPDGGVMQAELLHGWANPDGTRTVALRITLADGWKTYWRAPGGTQGYRRISPSTDRKTSPRLRCSGRDPKSSKARASAPLAIIMS